MKSFIRSLPYKFLLIGILLIFAAQASALSITPDTDPQYSGYENSQDLINNQVDNIIEGDRGVDWFELYKADLVLDVEGNFVEVSEKGDFSGSYNTVYADSQSDPSKATITWVEETDFIAPISHLLVKDGKQNEEAGDPPAWYLFELSAPEWNGMDTLSLTGFWPEQGAISHVSLYGNTQRVPEPAAMLLLGVGLVGIAGWTRGRLKKKG